MSSKDPAPGKCESIRASEAPGASSWNIQPLGHVRPLIVNDPPLPRAQQSTSHSLQLPSLTGINPAEPVTDALLGSHQHLDCDPAKDKLMKEKKQS